MKSLQETYAPNNQCFGCGPATEQGLRIRSFEEGDALVCDWTPQPHHVAFEGIVNGGIIGSLLDCHSNWTAAHHLMVQSGQSEPPCTVTADAKPGGYANDPLPSAVQPSSFRNGTLAPALMSAVGKNFVTGTHERFPIPSAEVQIAGLQQNPGY